MKKNLTNNEKSFSLQRKKIFVFQKYSAWNGVAVPADRRSACRQLHLFSALQVVQPTIEAVLAGRLQTEFGTGFEDGVDHAVAVAPTAGQ